MPLFKARKICPDLISVKGDGSKYKYIHEESLKIFNKYTNLVEPFSIDEAFLDITGTYYQFGSPEEIATKIKKDILKAFGSIITCSVGIGPNKLVAKLVSDLDKPNGLVIVTPENMQAVLKSCKLKDFCGIGPRIEFRLNNLGIFTVEQLQNTPLHFLYKHFGNVTGSFLKNASMGIHVGEVKSMDYTRPVKSVSHQHTLQYNTKNHKVLLNNFRRITEMVAKRMRNNQMLGKTIHISLRDSDRKWYGYNTKLGRYTDSGPIIYAKVEDLFNSLNWQKETRLVAVGVSNLIHEKYRMQPLFHEDQREELINKTVDNINDRWGKFTIIPASTLNADETKHKISSFLKHE